jgi:hypothetical protein
MANLSTLLNGAGEFFSKSFVKNSLKGAGIGLGSYVVLQGLYSTFLGYLQSNFSQLADIFYAINLSGLDVGLSIVVSAVNIRIFMNSKQIFLRKL